MNSIHVYHLFLLEKGYSLIKMNPGTPERALSFDDAFTAIEILEKSNIPILGGDILLKYNENFTYTGDNWAIEKKPRELNTDYLNRTYIETRSYLLNLRKSMKHEFFIVLVVEE